MIKQTISSIVFFVGFFFLLENLPQVQQQLQLAFGQLPFPHFYISGKQISFSNPKYFARLRTINDVSELVFTPSATEDLSFKRLNAIVPHYLPNYERVSLSLTSTNIDADGMNLMLGSLKNGLKTLTLELAGVQLKQQSLVTYLNNFNSLHTLHLKIDSAQIYLRYSRIGKNLKNYHLELNQLNEHVAIHAKQLNNILDFSLTLKQPNSPFAPLLKTLLSELKSATTINLEVKVNATIAEDICQEAANLPHLEQFNMDVPQGKRLRFCKKALGSKSGKKVEKSKQKDEL